MPKKMIFLYKNHMINYFLFSHRPGPTLSLHGKILLCMQKLHPNCYRLEPMGQETMHLRCTLRVYQVKWIVGME